MCGKKLLCVLDHVEFYVFDLLKPSVLGCHCRFLEDSLTVFFFIRMRITCLTLFHLFTLVFPSPPLPSLPPSLSVPNCLFLSLSLSWSVG